MDQATFKARRDGFSAAIGEGLAVIPAAAQQIRNADVEHPFRQNSDFFFLTGFDEPDALAVINPIHESERYVLFVRPRDRETETWSGYRSGVEGAVADYAADAAYPLADFDEKLRGYLLGRPALFYSHGDSRYDARITASLTAARRHGARWGVAVPDRVIDPRSILDDMRLHKSAAEIDRLRHACRISAAAHIEAMRFARPGLHEYQVQAALEYVFRVLGAPRPGYGSIVASGPNACVLHYVENRRRMEPGDLLTIDAGAEYGYLSADITRTFPVDGTFTPPQRALYEVVLSAQRSAAAKARPGSSMDDLHDTARRVLTEGLVELGLLPRSLEESLAMHHYREYFMHGTGHWLGMDVHDPGLYRTADRRGRPFSPSMALTIEPGLYVDPHRESVSLSLLEYDLDVWMERRYVLGIEAAKKLEAEEKEKAGFVEHRVPVEFRGLGVRVEDDILITEGGHENLTAAVPSAVDDIESLCAEPSRLPVL